MPTHAEAREALRVGFVDTMNEDPTEREVDILQAMAWSENNYGTKPSYFEGSHNWGGLQAGDPPCDPALTFEGRDKRPDGTPYAICFLKYATQAEGVGEFVYLLYARRPTLRAAAKRGDLPAVARAIHQTTYREGNTPELHAKTERQLRGVLKTIGRPWAEISGGVGGGAAFAAFAFLFFLAWLGGRE